jgi:hypothetical protein
MEQVLRENVYSSRFLAGCVKRYHTWPTLSQQTTGHHAWRVTCIFLEVFGWPRVEVLIYCLHHDSGELWAGDLPFGSKASVPALKEGMQQAEAKGLRMLEIRMPELTDIELVQCKICDLLEMHEFGNHEMRLGNRYARPIIADTLQAAQELAGRHQLSRQVNDWLRKQQS